MELPARAGVLAPIVQIHPTLRCNLRCLHCYSHSSPRENDRLSTDAILRALEGAFEQGYRTASFSGGEPLLSRDLGLMLRHAKALGMRTTVTSNGMLLTPERLAAFAAQTDVLAISLDGSPSTHDRMREYAGAFERMSANLEAVRQSGVDFGFIFTLTLHNVDEIAWAAEFAVAQGAKLFQIHPLEEVGRAAEELPGRRPDAVECAFAYLEAERIRSECGDRLFVQVDLFHRDLVARLPERFNAEEAWAARERLADCVSPIVIEADGTISPIGYGFGRRYAVGNVRERSFGALAKNWIEGVYPEFRALCRSVYAEACKPSPLPFFNWYEMLQAASLEADETPAQPYAPAS
jgi:MoaA/NifB/PqqE/SkfB family radical SAM enzyme